VNGRKVKSPTPLGDGDQILAGSFALTFRAKPPVASTKTEASR